MIFWSWSANTLPPSSVQNFFWSKDASTFFRSPVSISACSDPLSLSSDSVLYIASAVASVLSFPSVLAFDINSSKTGVIAYHEF